MPTPEEEKKTGSAGVKKEEFAEGKGGKSTSMVVPKKDDKAKKEK